MTEGQRARVREVMRGMVRWALKQSLQPDGFLRLMRVSLAPPRPTSTLEHLFL
jgi:hypothetical protein